MWGVVVIESWFFGLLVSLRIVSSFLCVSVLVFVLVFFVWFLGFIVIDMMIVVMLLVFSFLGVILERLLLLMYDCGVDWSMIFVCVLMIMFFLWIVFVDVGILLELSGVRVEYFVKIILIRRFVFMMWCMKDGIVFFFLK